jgi:GNAT superfamily N-acetyltransferase
VGRPRLSRRPRGGFRIRPARPSDAARFLALVEALARFEKLKPPDAAARRRLVRDAFGRRRIEVLLAEDGAGDVVAYAVFFETYSSFLARPTLYLEDLFVHPDHRRRGIAGAMMRRLASIAKRRGSGRMEWMVLDWNRGAKWFYEALGASRLGRWQLYRLERRGIERVATRNAASSSRAR